MNSLCPHRHGMQRFTCLTCNTCSSFTCVWLRQFPQGIHKKYNGKHKCSLVNGLFFKWVFFFTFTFLLWLVLYQTQLFSYVQVYSGYRFLLAARERRLPVAILNIGPTRADHLAELKVSARCGEVLPILRASWDQEQPLEGTFPLL